MNIDYEKFRAGLKSKADIQNIYDRFAPGYRYENLLNDYLFGVKKLRKWLVQHAGGEILDIACGTGEFFPFFYSGIQITAVDLSPGMLAVARKRALKLGFLNAGFQVMDAEELDFPDESFDTILSALSTCTFQNPIKALREMKRVCRENGRILLLEHGRSDWEFIGNYQDRSAFDHFQTAGCRWNQEPLELLERAGLDVQYHQQKTFGVFHAFVVQL